jgi:putative transposase
MDEINAVGKTLNLVQQAKCLNNIVEHDHWAIKRITKSMRNFKSFLPAKKISYCWKAMPSTRLLIKHQSNFS